MQSWTRALAMSMVIATAALYALPAVAVPVKVPYSGQLAEAGELVNGARNFNFKLCRNTACAGADKVYEQTQNGVQVTNGAFSVQIGSDNLLQSTVFKTSGLLLKITVGSTVLGDVALPFTPYAADTPDALLLDGTRAMTGALDLGGEDINNAGDVDATSLTATTVTATTLNADSIMVDGMATNGLTSTENITVSLDTDNNDANAFFRVINGAAANVISVDEAGLTTLEGALNAKGNVTLGDAGSDTITFTGMAASALNMNNNVANNVGNAGTDFLANGGLTLANALTVTTGGATVTGNSSVAGTLSQTGGGQVTLSGNVDAQNGLDVTTAALTFSNVLTQSGAGQVTFTGNVDAGSGLDVTGNISVSGTVDGVDVSGHDSATTGVHGVGAGNIVGTTLAQTLTNKTLTSPSVTTLTVTSGGAAITGNSSVAGTLSQTGGGQVSFSGNVDAANGLDVTTAPLTLGSQNITGVGANITGAGAVTLGTAANGNITLDANGTGVVNVSDNLNATAGLDVTTAALTFNNVLTQSGAGQVTFTGNVDAGSGLDVTGNISVSGTVDGVDVAGHSTATTGVHGVGAGDIVGTTLAQTLTNKTLTSPSVTTLTVTSGGAAITGNSSVVGTLSQTGGGQVSFSGNVNAANGLDVTTAPLTLGSQNITGVGANITGAGAVTLGTSAGGSITLDANGSGVVNVSDNLNATAGLDVTTANLTVGVITFNPTTGAGSATTLATTDTGASSLDVAGGINAGTGNVSIVGADGRIPTISSTTFASLDGSALTNVSASGISSTGDVIAQLDSDNNGTNSFFVRNGTAGNALTVAESGNATFANGATSNLTLDLSAASPTLSSSTGNVTVNDALSQTGSGNQVSFAGNVDATNGLDVTTANLTVGAITFNPGTGAGSATTLATTNTGASSLDVAGGINAGSGNVSIIGTDGRIPTISSTTFASLDGSNLTNVSAATAVDFTGVLAGDVAGMQSATVIQANAVALTTDTTGNYVGSVATVDGLAGGAAGSEGATLSVGLDYTATLGGNPSLLTGRTQFASTGIIFEGATADGIEGLLTVTDPTTTDKTWILPNVDGTVITTGNLSSITSVGTLGSLAVTGLLSANGGVNLTATTLSGTTAVIDFNNFDVSSAGDVSFNGGLSSTFASTERATLTMNAADASASRAIQIDVTNTNAGGVDSGLRINNLVGSSEVLDAGIIVENDDSDAGDGMAVGVLVQGTGTDTITTAFDATDTAIVNALDAGTNTILGTTAVIAFTNFGVTGTGNTTVGGTLGVTGSVSANGGVNLTAQTLSGTTAVIDFTNFDVTGAGNTTVGGTLVLTPQTPTVAATIAVTGSVMILGASGTAVDTLSGATNGQVLTIRATGAVTVNDNDTNAGNVKLGAGGDFAMTADDTLQLVFDGTNWLEIARSVN